MGQIGCPAPVRPPDHSIPHIVSVSNILQGILSAVPLPLSQVHTSLVVHSSHLGNHTSGRNAPICTTSVQDSKSQDVSTINVSQGPGGSTTSLVSPLPITDRPPFCAVSHTSHTTAVSKLIWYSLVHHHPYLMPYNRRGPLIRNQIYISLMRRTT